MAIVYHKFRNHQVNSETKILILGTFNPDVENGPDFFYGRPHNFLWKLLPGCWGKESLKNKLLEDKIKFMDDYKIDFADIIHAVNVPENQKNNINDAFIDDKVEEWKDIITLINLLPKLEAVYFTRKTFGSIKNIEKQIGIISSYCNKKQLRFCLLETPSRFYNNEKQEQWIDTIINRNNNLKVKKDKWEGFSELLEGLDFS